LVSSRESAAIVRLQHGDAARLLSWKKFQHAEALAASPQADALT
jgi:hypothetical protein